MFEWCSVEANNKLYYSNTSIGSLLRYTLIICLSQEGAKIIIEEILLLWTFSDHLSGSIWGSKSVQRY